MKLSQQLHQKLRLKNRLLNGLLFVSIGVCAWLSYQYPLTLDVTVNNRNSLAEPSIQLLKQLHDPVDITAYIKRGLPLRNQLMELIERYRRLKPDLHLVFVDPSEQPDKIRELDIGAEGAIVVAYQGRQEKITFVNETSLSNTLLQLISADEHWVSFLSGHGERSPIGTANFDLGQFGKQLVQHHYHAQPLNLSTLPDIPDNSAVLVIAGPTVDLLPAELDIIRRYIARGGNLWLNLEPGDERLQPLLTDLGIEVLPGTMVDNKSKLYGINNATFVLLSAYESHAITRNLETMSLFPKCAALKVVDDGLFNSQAVLKTSAEAWNETGELAAVINFEAERGEVMGPLNLGFALTRQIAGKEQRIMVVGDGDFLSNAFLNNVGNLDLGLRIMKWLAMDDKMLDIPARMAPDNRLALTPFSIGVIGFGFLLVLPLLLILSGFMIWRKRKRR